jgi:hypothetical protein
MSPKTSGDHVLIFRIGSEGYGTWIEYYVNNGWTPYLFTFMFNPLASAQQVQVAQMHEEITTVYRKLATRVVRKPRSVIHSQLLPKGIFFLDAPVFKRQKQPLRDVSVNDGLHMHGVIVAKTTRRLQVGLDEHFRDNQGIYLTPKLHRIHVKLIDHLPFYVTGYAGKALKSPRFTGDDVLILPQSTGELREQRVVTGEARNIRDIQSRFNVSDEIARAVVANKAWAKG